MPSREYLEEILRRVKGFMPPDDFAALNRAAIPRSGGLAAWRQPGLSKLEELALRELRPAMLQRAQEDELAQIWGKLAQWRRRAGRRGLDQAPFERAAGHVMQEMLARGMGAAGPLAKSARAASTLEARLAELPDRITLESPAASLELLDDSLSVACEDKQQGFAVAIELAKAGVPALLAPSRNGADSSSLYDLALVRPEPIRKSISDPPEWIVKEAQHTGAMVALMAPPEARGQLIEAGAIQPDAPGDLHVTLLYLGEAATLSQPMIAAIQNQVRAVCAEHLPLRVKLTGVGRFDTAVFALASAVGMSQLQADLERAISAVTHLPSKHGFIPHMTLGQGGQDVPNLEGLDIGWPADTVTIKVGGMTLAEFPLEGGAPSEVAPWDTAETLGCDPEPKSVRVLCSSAPEKQVIYYMVSEPFTEDYHGHRISPDDVENALHSYMAGERRVHFEHGASIDGRAVVVEGYVAPCELTSFHGQQLDEPVQAGSSIVGIHYTDRALWEKLSEEPHGISWGGTAEQEVV